MKTKQTRVIREQVTPASSIPIRSANGLEHSPYKREVMGSSPIGWTIHPQDYTQLELHMLAKLEKEANLKMVKKLLVAGGITQGSTGLKWKKI